MRTRFLSPIFFERLISLSHLTDWLNIATNDRKILPILSIYDRFHCAPHAIGLKQRKNSKFEAVIIVNSKEFKNSSVGETAGCILCGRRFFSFPPNLYLVKGLIEMVVSKYKYGYVQATVTVLRSFIAENLIFGLPSGRCE